MANANINNITKRTVVNRPLTFTEGDTNLQELINVIEDQQAFEQEQSTINQSLMDTDSALQSSIDDLETNVDTLNFNVSNLTNSVDALEQNISDLESSDPGKGASLISTGNGKNVQTEIDARIETFDTVDDMKAATWLKVGQKVQTLGYYSIGDGGRNVYEIVSAGTGTEDGGSYINLSGSGLQAKGFFDREVRLEQFGVIFDDSTDNTDAIQAAINYAARNGISEITSGPGVCRFSRLWFSYDPVHNQEFPSTIRSGWGLKFSGSGRLYTEPTTDIETEIGNTLGTVFRSTETVNDCVNAIVNDTNTTQHGLRFKDVAFVGSTSGFIFRGSAIPNSDLFDNVSFHNTNDAGNGVIVEDVWVSDWANVLISCNDYNGSQTGTSLILRNRLFSGGGMWSMRNINVRGGEHSAQIGYMEDSTDDIKLLDSIVINVIQCRNARYGLELGGKVRSAHISGYHTEGCTEVGCVIAAEAGSVTMIAPYFDCAICSDSSLILGNASGVAGSNVDERFWSEVRITGFNFIDTNNVAIKIADGSIGNNLELSSGKIGKVSGSGLLGIDFNSFQGNVRLDNVRFTGLATNYSGINPDRYIDDGNWEKRKDSNLYFDKSEIVVETLSSTKFLNALSPEKNIITPTASFGRVVMPNPASMREFFFHNADATISLAIRDNSNSTTLYTLPPGESINVISDGSNWIFY